MKTIELLNSVPKKKRNEVVDSLKDNKRVSLFHLAKYLVKNLQQHQINKEELYQQVFQEKYLESKDYLLRNELRLLNDYLEDVLIDLQIAITIKKDKAQTTQLLLTYYLENQLIELYEKEWKTAFKEATEKENIQQTTFLLEQWVKFVSLNKEVHFDLYHDTACLLHEFFPTIQTNALVPYLKYKETFFLINKILTSVKKEYIAPILTESISIQYPELLGKPVAIYLGIHQASTMAGESKIKVLEEMIVLLDSILEKNKHQTSYLELKVRILSNIGVDFFILNESDKALQYYTKALLVAEKEQLASFTSILFNFLSACIATQQYTLFITYYSKHETLLVKNPSLQHRCKRFYAIALLFLGQPDAAMEAITHDIFERPDNDYYYFRGVYCFIYLLKKDLESAERETQNTIRSLQYNQLESTNFYSFFTLLKKYLLNLYEDDKNKKQSKQTQILQELEKDIQQSNEHLVHLSALLKHLLLLP